MSTPATVCRIAASIWIGMALTVAAIAQSDAEAADRTGCPGYLADAWASVHADCRNSDFAPVTTPTKQTVAWTALGGAALINPGTVDMAGRHFVTSARGPGHSHLHAFDASGRLLWESAPQQSSDDLDSAAGFNAPVLDTEGHLYLGDANQMWAFRPDGAVKWVAALPVAGEPFVYQIITAQGHVGGITVGGNLVLYRRGTGALAVPVFQLPRGVAPESGPSLPGLWQGGLMDEAVIELFKRIAFGYGVQVANAPAVHPLTGRIFITAAGPERDGELSGVLYGLDVESEAVEIAFAVPMSGGSGTSPAISPDGGTVYSAGGDGDMLAVDTGSGAVRWRSRGEGLLSPAIGPDGRIYTGDIFGTPTVIALDPATGRQAWGQNYDAHAATVLPRLPPAPPEIPTGEPIARLVSVVSVSGNAVWVGLALGYEYRQAPSGPPLIIPHANAVCALQPDDGRLIECTPVRDSLEAMIGIDARGHVFASHAAIFSSTFFYGLNDKLPARYRLREPPAGGLSVLAADGAADDLPLHVQPRIADELRGHTEYFRKQIYRVGERVYSAVGWNIANIVMIEGDDGIVLVDAGLSPQTSAEVLAEFREITDKPIRAVIYSHFHHDHIDGVKGLITEAQAASGDVRLIAHSSLIEHLVDESLLLGPILALRGGYTFGFLLGPEDRLGMNAGIGPLPVGGRPGTFIAPNEVVDDRLVTEIAGVRLEILHVPSEAPDELAVYLPDDRVLIDTEVIQGPTFPNVYSLRGTKFRDPATWVESIDRLRALRAEHLVPTHGRPVSGAQRVEEVLSMTRDGIQFVLDQTVRYMNKGYTPDELVAAVRLPPHLESYSPYLRQYYGTVAQAVREIYAGHLGWFAGDPVALDPVAPAERDRRLVAMMGGSDAVLEEARRAYAAADYQWAAELATRLIRIDHAHVRARQIKAAAFRQMAYRSININWRNWYLTSAMELDGRLEPQLEAIDMRAVFLPPDIVAALPARSILQNLTSRLRAEQTLDLERSLGIRLTDSQETFGLAIHRGVCRFQDGPPPDADMTVSLERATLNAIVTGDTDFATALQSGLAELRGDRDDFLAFVGYFEDPWNQTPRITVR